MSPLASFAIAFGVIALVELPDKTFVATLVLSARYRPRPVLLGVGLAFAAQCTIAAAAGSVITLLPRRWVAAVVAVMFAFGAVVLLREARRPGEDDVELADHRENLSFARIMATSFGVLFAAEWGDASQLATAGLVARHRSLMHTVVTAAGAWVALMTVATLAVVVGAAIVRRVPLRRIHLIGGALFGVFAAVLAVSAVRG